MSEAKYRILLVDDDPDLLRLLSMRLTGAGFEVSNAESGERALAQLSIYRPHLVISDLRMEGMDGMALFDAIREVNSSVPVIILTAHGSIAEAVEATKRGVFSFLTKPVNGRDLVLEIENALSVSGGGLGEGPEDAAAAWRRDLITQSPVMEDLLSKAKLAAESGSSILIRGESGTGKEMLAQAIHRVSSRAEHPFVAAHGGTLFLDEIGDMPLPLQVKLLRVLQERQVRPVGATRPIPVDVRIVSATHRDLENEITEGNFREDLYYRLNVVSLGIPSLMQRREDIPLLANYFLKKLTQENRKKINNFAPDAMEVLLAAPWPGNVRQLLNVVEQAVALATTPVISADLLNNAIRETPEKIPSFAEARRKFEQEYLVRLLQITKGNVSQAARLAKRNRTDFYKLLQRHHIVPTMFKS